MHKKRVFPRELIVISPSYKMKWWYLCFRKRIYITNESSKDKCYEASNFLVPVKISEFEDRQRSIERLRRQISIQFHTVRRLNAEELKKRPP